MTKNNSHKDRLIEMLRQKGLRVLVQAFLIMLAFGVLYRDTLAHIFGSWSTPEDSYGPLILAVSLYIVWMKRKDFQHLAKSPELLWGALLAGLGCFMLFAGKISSTMLLQQISIVPALMGAVLLFWGWAYFKALFIPVSYLIFLTGFVELILGSTSIYLQRITAWIAVQLLELNGMPVFLTATVIELPYISLDVVRACSGVNHITALMALAVPLAVMSRMTPFRKVLLVLTALFIGIFANGLRVALIGIYTRYSPDSSIHGPAETLYVSFVFFFGMVLLVIISHFISKKTQKRPEKAQSPVTSSSESGDEPIRADSAAENIIVKRRYAVYAVAGAIFVITLGFVYWYKPSPVPPGKPLVTLPLVIAGSMGEAIERIDDRLRPFPADEELLRDYADSSGKQVALYIGYFNSQSREKKIIDYRRAWMHEETQRVPVGHASKTIMINKTQLGDRYNSTNVYFWYLMDGRIITNRYAGKFFTFWDGLIRRKTNGAVIIIQTRNTEAEVMPFLRELVPIIRTHLSVAY